MTPSSVSKELALRVSEGATFKIAGSARHHPEQLFESRLRAKHKISLFETDFYLSNVLQIPELRFFVAYLIQRVRSRSYVYPRIIYKDLSLTWRSASHFSVTDGEIWIGKGDVRDEIQNGVEMVVSVESTTDLPLEMQTALESLLSWTKRPQSGKGVIESVLRQAPSSRVEPYRDFVLPRVKASANRKNLINRGRPIARFTRRNDPESLKLTSGFEPDFAGGIIERSQSKSRLYGGQLHRFRILSTNRQIQYYFIAGPKHVWIIPPQALTTELSSYGVRTIDVLADDDLFVPGYEYHHFEETKTGFELYSQIPEGFAGEVCPVDDAKADASPWLDRIPLIQQFRREVLE